MMNEQISNELESEEEIKAFRAQVAGEVFGDAPSTEFEESEQLKANAPGEVSAAETQSENLEDEQNVQAEAQGEIEKESPNDLQTTLDGINSKLSTFGNIEYRLKQMESRVGSVQNAVQNQKKAAEEAELEAKRLAENAPSEEEIAAAVERKKRWEELTFENPDLEDPLKVIEDRFSELDAETKKVPDVEKIRQEIQAQFDSEIVAAKQEIEAKIQVDMVRLHHPEFEKTLEEPLYKTWLPTQPLEVQEKALKSGRAVDAISVLDSFNEYKAEQGKDKGKTPEQILEERKERLDSSTSPSLNGKTTKKKSEDDMTDAEWRAHLSKHPELI